MWQRSDRFPLTHDCEVMMKRHLSMLIAIALMSVMFRPVAGAEPPAVAITAKMVEVTDELNRKQTGKPPGRTEDHRRRPGQTDRLPGEEMRELPRIEGQQAQARHG